MTVDYTTADGTALAGSDYQPASGTLTFAAGDDPLTIAVPVIGDTVAEPTKTFRLVLSNPNGATLGSRVQATGTIVDNDVPPAGGSEQFAVPDDWGAGFVAGMTMTNNRQ